jgi:hypothetical protein
MQLSMLFLIPKRKILVLLLLLTALLGQPPEFFAADPGSNAPGDPNASGPAREEPSQATPPLPANEQKALQELKHRYRQDHTGVRARLGLCRRCEGEPGCGPHRHRFRGGREQEP